MRVLAHMAAEKRISQVFEAFLDVDKGEHEVNYLITDYEPFTKNLRDETLQITEYGRTNLAYKMEVARKTALTMGYDAIFNVEDDNVVPKNALVKLIEADKDLICGVYRYRPSRKPNIPLMPEKRYNRDNFDDSDLDKGVLNAFLIPWGCTLFRRNVLKKVKFPVGLDGHYCDACRDAGIDRWVHMDVRVGHIDVAPDGSMIEIKV